MIDFNRDNVKRIVIVRRSPAIDFATACAEAVKALQRISDSFNKCIDFDEVAEAFKRCAEQAYEPGISYATGTPYKDLHCRASADRPAQKASGYG